VFERGRVYRRDEVHNAWGGTTKLQPQGGILTPVEAPVVIVVTGEAGGRYGYADEWDEDGVFHYYGAGRQGDMVFRTGNLALRDHAVNGEDVHVFEQAKPSGMRYEGQFVCAGYYERDNVPDVDGNLRRAIVFELVSLDEEPPPAAGTTPPAAGPGSRWTMPLEDLRNRASSTVGNQPNASEAKRRTYARSEDLRVYVRRRADGRCEGCGTPAPFVTARGHPYLEPHHTRRLSDGGPDDYHHVIALCPTCHRRVHHADDGESYNDALKQRLREIESSGP
jgi:5-methylcytosine-specific restriction protein A